MTIHQQYRLSARVLFVFAATALMTLAFSTVVLAQAKTPYQQYRFTSCSVNQNCTVDFPTVPASSRLDITNVSCFIEIFSPPTTSPGVRFAQLLVLRSNNSILTVSTLLLEQQSSTFIPNGGGNIKGFAANHAVAVFANAGQRFQGYVDPLGANDRVSFMACHISGNMVKLG